ncbi:response regulator [Piscirickettsia litoralis]|uniref:Fis family transcriptional regulator n=1 Tax=Piscirickettsia litoralis TaxID=1891921 RepID=A0ABX3A7P3_9GAMM|nr:response regulator [Piscirickettsia litoralis]ODN42119.1 Fis family transcriptional regulator [Piscirickettsia litoralis]
MAKILIVDDASSMRQMVSFTLKTSGHDVEEAFDGNDGLSKAQCQQFDLVITDINMPNMDGITLVKKLRENTSYKFTPILVLTTESDGSKKSEGKAAGATGWLIKPFNPDQLTNTVQKVLG